MLTILWLQYRPYRNDSAYDRIRKLGVVKLKTFGII